MKMYTLLEITCEDKSLFNRELLLSENSLAWRRVAERIKKLAPEGLRPLYGYAACNRLLLLFDIKDTSSLNFIISRIVSEEFNSKAMTYPQLFEDLDDCREELIYCAHMFWAAYGSVLDELYGDPPDKNSFTGVGFSLCDGVDLENWNASSPYPAVMVFNEIVKMDRV